jgi:hypothetical protein
MSTSAAADGLLVHRIGGGAAGNLLLKPAEAQLTPPGLSLLSGGSPEEAARAMRQQFPRMAPQGQTVVGSATVGQIRKAGFEVIMNPTLRFPQPARLTHPEGATGFTEENRERLARCFTDHTGL